MKLFRRSSKASAAENANLIMLSDGTYKEKGRKASSKSKTSTKKSKKSSTKTTKKKRGGLFSRKKDAKKSKQQSSKVLEAVTIQYPGIPNANDVGVELDLSFDTAATTDTSNELDQFLAELEAAKSEKDDQDKEEPKPEEEKEEPKSSSMLGRAFPRLFDEEGYMRCGCGPSSAPEDVNDDDLTITSGNKSSDKDKKSEVKITVTASTATDDSGDHSKTETKDIATTTDGDHSKAKDIPKNKNAASSTTSDATALDNSKANIEYVCNPSPKAAPKATASKQQKDKVTKKGKAKAKASASSKAAAAKGAVAASRSAKPPSPTTTNTGNKAPATSLAKTSSRIVAHGEYDGPVSIDAFYKEGEPEDDASKKEVEQITLMESYKSENESLKAEIQRLKHLKTLEDENESLKAEVLKLQMGMSVVNQMAQDMKEGGEEKEVGDDMDPAQIQKEWEEGAVTGMFVRLANMFDEDGFIKCMAPSAN